MVLITIIQWIVMSHYLITLNGMKKVNIYVPNVVWLGDKGIMQEIVVTLNMNGEKILGDRIC